MHINKTTTAVACLLSAVGALVFNTFPIFLSNIAQQFSFNEAQIGGMAMAYLGGFSVVALFSPLWVPRCNWRACSSLAFAFILLGMAGLLWVEAALVDYCMMVLGLGSGVIFTLGLAILAAAKDPDRAFGIKLSVEMVFAGIVMLAMTLFIVSTFGFVGFVVALLLLYGLSALSLRWLPDNFLVAEATPDKAKNKALGFNWPALFASAALFVMFSTLSAIWGFMVNIGVASNIDASRVEILVSVSVLFGIGGAALCAFIGQRFGHLLPLSSAMLLIIALLLLLNTEISFVVFAAIVFSINALLQFLVALQMGLVTESDNNGPYTVMIAFLLASGGAIGPEVFGAVVVDQGYSSAYYLAIGATLIAIVLTIITAKLLSLRRTGEIKPL